MGRYFSILLWLLALNLTTAHAGHKVRRQVLLPDGTPAVGAKIILRRFAAQEHGEPKLQTETVFLTDARGQFEIELEDNEIRGSVLIDAAGCALALAPLHESWTCLRMPGQRPRPIQLIETYELLGHVVNARGVPVVGAQVVLADPLWNWVATGVSTPQLITESAADGSFSMRGISDLRYFDQERWSIYAIQRDRTKVVALGLETVMLKISKPEPHLARKSVPPRPVQYQLPLQYEPPRIVLHPTVSVGGQVVNPVLNQPVDGATVALDTADCYLPLRPMKTGADGRFEFFDVPILPSMGETRKDAYPLRIAARHPALPMVQTSLHEHVAFGKVAAVYQVTLHMRPLTTLSGRMIDIETGKPPLWPPLLMGYDLEVDAAGFYQSGEGVQTQIAPATGTFSMRLKAGPDQVGLSGPGFYTLEELLVNGRNVYRQNGIDLPAPGYSNVLIKARKQPGFWIHLDTDDVETNSGGSTFTLRTREKINGGTEHSLRREWNFLPAAKWGDVIEARVMREQNEVLPWTKLVADRQRSPIVISIPTKTPGPALMGPNLPLRYSKFNFKLDFCKPDLRVKRVGF